MNLIPFNIIIMKVFLPIIKVIIIATIMSIIISANSEFIDIIVKFFSILLIICIVGMSKNEILGIIRIIRKKA